MSEISYELKVEGGEEGAQTFETLKIKQLQASDASKRVATELRKLQQAGTATAAEIEALQREYVRASSAAEQFARQARAVAGATGEADGAQRGLIGGSAEMVNMLTEMSLGFGGLHPAVREFSVQLAAGGNNVVQLSRVMGPLAGTITGLGMSLVPLLITKIVEWTRETDDASDANDRLARSARAAARDTRDLVTAMRQREELQRLQSGRATAEEQGRVITQVRAMRSVIEESLVTARAEAAQAERNRMALRGTVEEANRRIAVVRQLEGHVRSLTEQEERLTAAQADRVAGELSASALDMAAEGEAEDLASAGGHSARRARQHRDDIEGRLHREQQFFLELERLRDQDFAAERRALEQRRRDMLRVDQDIAREMEREDRERHRALLARNREAAREQQRLLRQQEREAERAQEDLQRTVSSVLQPMITGLGQAIGDIITGAKTADEAFRGLLASFLEMLSQMAALEAVKNYAAAIGAFASQNYAGGALHIAAGVAWTAVAVAAGAGAVAAAPPAAATSAPTAPQEGMGGGGGGSSQTIVHVNGPIMLSGDRGSRAEFGRELGRMIDAGNARHAA